MTRFMKWMAAALLIALVFSPCAQAAGDGSSVYRALLIGVDSYQANALSGCVTDAGRMASALQAANEAGSFYQTPAIRTNLLSDEILAAFDETAAWDADEDDVTFVYFAGHGYMSDKGAAAIVGKDSKMIRLSDIREKLDAVPGVKVVVLDCRYADSLLAKEPSAPAALATFNKAVVETFSTGATAANYYVFTAATLAGDEAKALGAGDSARGMVTYYLTQGCGYDYEEQRPDDALPADENDNGAVSLTEARDYVEAELANLTNAGEIARDIQIYPENSAYPVLARRAIAEVLEVSLPQGEVTVPAGRTVQLEATTQPANASARSISWTSSDLSIATVDEDGMITGVKPGSARIAATTANGLTVSTGVLVRDVKFVDSLTLSAPRLAVAEGSKTKLDVTVVPDFANENLTWSSDNQAVATVDMDGNVTCVGAGGAVITVASENGVEASCALQVVERDKVVTGIALNKSQLNIYAGEARQIEAKVKPANAADPLVEFASADPEIATVDLNGTVLGVSEGTTTITATASSGISTQASVTVQAASIKLSKNAVNLKSGKTVALKTQIKPATLTGAITWTSDNEDVAKVIDGKITAVATGETIVTATLESGVSAQCAVTVNGVPVKRVRVSPAKTQMTIGDQKELSAKILPEKATSTALTWASSDENVVRVDDTGALTAVGAGRAIVSAKAAGGAKARCVVTVKPTTVSQITLSETALTLTANLNGADTATLTAETTPVSAGNTALKWVSSNNRVATVDNTGLVTAKSAGKALIRVSSGKTKATCQVTVQGNGTVNKKPVAGEEEKLYTSARRIAYKGNALIVDLFFTNKTKAALAVPEAGALTLTLADGTSYTLQQIEAGKKKLKAGKSGAISYKIPVAQGDPFYGLDLRGASAQILKEGELPDIAAPAAQPLTDDDLGEGLDGLDEDIMDLEEGGDDAGYEGMIDDGSDPAV